MVCPPDEHPTADLSASGSLVVRAAAREHDSHYDTKVFGLEDFSDLTCLSVVAEMETVSLPFLAINTSPLSPQTRTDTNNRTDTNEILVVFVLYYQLLNHSDLLMG